MNKVALVTGGAVRLGKEIAHHLGKSGYDIALHYNSSQEAATESQIEIKNAGVDCRLFSADLAQENDLIKRVVDSFSRCDLLINSASWYYQSNIRSTDEDSLTQAFNVNLKAPFLLCRDFANLCKTGNIINILDNKIKFNQYEYAAYLLSKKSLAELTLIAAIEFAPDIRVNGISPGVVMPMSSRPSEYIEWRLETIPLKKMGNAGNIMQGIDYILSNDFVSGQILTIDGAENENHIGRNAAEYGL